MNDGTKVALASGAGCALVVGAIALKLALIAGTVYVIVWVARAAWGS